jgi:hypothetical protein
VLCALVFGVAGNASAAPPTNRCPEGFELITVAKAESEGYALAREMDEFAGNPPSDHDGYVCRRPLGDGVFRDVPNRITVYRSLDNSVR